MLRQNHGEHVLSQWLTLSAAGSLDELPLTTASSGSTSRVSTKTSLMQVHERVVKLLTALPQPLVEVFRPSHTTDHFVRFLERETVTAETLLTTIRGDLELAEAVCAGRTKSTNAVRQVVETLQTESVPSNWKRYAISPQTTLTEWVLDFAKRVQQLRAMQNSPNHRANAIWFGGLLSPEAFLTAARQMVAQQNGWSLEDVRLVVEIGAAAAVDERSFVVSGLTLENAVRFGGFGGLGCWCGLGLGFCVGQLKRMIAME